MIANNSLDLIMYFPYIFHHCMYHFWGDFVLDSHAMCFCPPLICAQMLYPMHNFVFITCLSIMSIVYHVVCICLKFKGVFGGSMHILSISYFLFTHACILSITSHISCNLCVPYY